MKFNYNAFNSYAKGDAAGTLSTIDMAISEHIVSEHNEGKSIVDKDLDAMISSVAGTVYDQNLVAALRGNNSEDVKKALEKAGFKNEQGAFHLLTEALYKNKHHNLEDRFKNKADAIPLIKAGIIHVLCSGKVIDLPNQSSKDELKKIEIQIALESQRDSNGKSSISPEFLNEIEDLDKLKHNTDYIKEHGLIINSIDYRNDPEQYLRKRYTSKMEEIIQASLEKQSIDGTSTKKLEQEYDKLQKACHSEVLGEKSSLYSFLINEDNQQLLTRRKVIESLKTVDLSTCSLNLAKKVTQTIANSPQNEQVKDDTALGTKQKLAVIASCALGPLAFIVYKLCKNHNIKKQEEIEQKINSELATISSESRQITNHDHDMNIGKVYKIVAEKISTRLKGHVVPNPITMSNTGASYMPQAIRKDKVADISKN